jgi:hypothetical protein
MAGVGSHHLLCRRLAALYALRNPVYAAIIEPTARGTSWAD